MIRVILKNGKALEFTDARETSMQDDGWLAIAGRRGPIAKIRGDVIDRYEFVPPKSRKKAKSD